MTNNTDPNAIATASDGEIHEPRLGVYVLTEFVFCPRAGLCAHETGHNEEENSPPLSYFSFNPLYTLGEIEAALQRAISEMTWFVGVPGSRQFSLPCLPSGLTNSSGSRECSASSGF